MFSVFTSNSFAETKIKYKTYKKLPCKFNGAILATSANASLERSKRCKDRQHFVTFSTDAIVVSCRWGNLVVIRNRKVLLGIGFVSDLEGNAAILQAQEVGTGRLIK